MWDNREKKRNPKAPDFKCKDKNCDGVIWPPKGQRPANGQQSTPVPPQRAASGNGNDDRSNRIERQHSQEMALRYFALSANGQVPDTKKLTDMISWFQRDVGRSPQKEQQESEDVF